MNKWIKITLVVLAGALLAAFAAVNVISRREAIAFVHITRAERLQRPIDESALRQSPADYNLPFEDVTVTSDDGVRLVGWYVPPENGALILLLHGYEEFRYHMLEEAAMLHRHGYGSLLATVRAHDLSDGEVASFGCGDREMVDLETWFQFARGQAAVDPSRIGILGQSMGGSLVIQYASRNPEIGAVVAHSPFASVPDTIETVVTWKTGLPGRLFAPFMLFWGSRELDCDLSTISAREWIGEISPRAVFILDAGLDDAVSVDSGELLFAAAGEPKEWWFCPECGHHEFDTMRPREFEERVVGFFDRYLPAQ